MSASVSLAIVASIGIVAFTSALIYTIRTFAQIAATIATAQPDTHIHLPETPAPEVHLDLATLDPEPDPTPGYQPDPTLTLPDYGSDPTDGTVPRINVDWAPDLEPDPDTLDYIPDPTDPATLDQ